VARQILTEVPLIDGWVWLIDDSFN
jgi:hypothetical protein